MKKILNGTVELDSKHRLVIVLPPCWQYIKDKLSQEIKCFSKKYLYKRTCDMCEEELDETDRFNNNCDMLEEIYAPFFMAVRKQDPHKKGKKYQESVNKNYNINMW